MAGENKIKNRIKQVGFTLLELMITVALVGIIASVAISSFSNNVMTANRTDGRAKLLEEAVVLEKCKAIYGVYNNNCSITSSSSVISSDGYYMIAPTALTSSTYTLTAYPVASGPQSNDTQCTSITLTHLGVQGGTGALLSECW